MPASPRDPRPSSPPGAATPRVPDLAEIRGQEAAKRALEVAAAGGHHLLLVGPPGGGKTTLARAFHGLLPPLPPELRETVAELHARAGLPPPAGPPLRAPDPGVGRGALVGRRRPPRPGDASLATGGVLLLDGLHHFRPQVLAGLEEPLASGRAPLTSGDVRLEYPARFVLVATAAPCPCGHRGDRRHPCRCTPAAVRRHWRTVSGAFLDRLDLVAEVPVPELRELRAPPGEPTAEVARRVRGARRRQEARTGERWNGELGSGEVRAYAALDPSGHELLEGAFGRLGLSARGTHAVLRVARTVADLAGSDGIRAPHVAEALQYRSVGPRSLP